MKILLICSSSRHYMTHLRTVFLLSPSHCGVSTIPPCGTAVLAAMVSTGTATWEDTGPTMTSRRQTHPQQPRTQTVAANAPVLALPVRSGEGILWRTVTNRLHQKTEKSWPTSDPGYSNGNQSSLKLFTLAGLSLDLYNVSEHGLQLFKFHRFSHLLIHIAKSHLVLSERWFPSPLETQQRWLHVWFLE